MKHFLRIVKILFIDIATIVLGYYALFQHVHWASNLFNFLTILCMVIGLCCLFDDDMKDSARRKGRVTPLWLSQLVDVILVCGCAATGSYWLAVSWLISAAGEVNVFGDEA